MAETLETALNLFELFQGEERKEYITRLFAKLGSAEQRKLLEAMDPSKTSKQKADVRAFVLCKSSLSSDRFLDCFALDPDTGEEREGYRSYISLGSLADSIQTFELNKPSKLSLLQTVFKANNSLSNQLDGTVFANPQYVIYHYNEGTREAAHLKDFWSKNQDEQDKPENNFFFMTTYNLRAPNVSYEERTRLRNELRDKICEYRDEIGGTYRYLVYDSLDLLNDFVVFWKSTYVRPILETLNRCYLFSNRHLGHTRTIFAVDSHKLRDEARFELLLNHIDCPTDEVKKSIASIDNMTIRAVSNDYNALKRVKEDLLELEKENVTRSDEKGKHCFVLGNTNHISFFHGVDDRLLCMYLKRLIEFAEPGDLSDAIVRIETNIGIDEDELLYGQNSIEKPVSGDKILLNKATEYLIHKMRKILQDERVFDEICAPWKHTVLELCNQLRHMSDSCIYDSVCFLLLDSVYLFQQWLEQRPYQALQKNMIDDAKAMLLLRQAQHINNYVHNWMHLTDIIARALGVVAHMPGYSPALYHMSTAILEFCHSFFCVTATYLRKLGDTKITGCEDDIACILIPTQCRRIKTFEDFEEGVDDSKLVNVEVPLELLSNPLKIVTMLTHEAGHRYGLSDLCQRECRWDCYAGALALVVSGAIGQKYSLEEIQSLACPLPEDTKNFRLATTIDRCVEHIKDRINGRLSDGHLRNIAEHLAYLFKESYADLIAILLLKCEFRTYFENIYLHQPEWERLRLGLITEEDASGLPGNDNPNVMQETKGCQISENVRARLAMRLFIVCKAMQNFFPELFSLSDSDWSGYQAENTESRDDQQHLEEHIRMIRENYEELEEADETLSDYGADKYFNPIVLKSCMEYLKVCGETITNAFDEADEKAKGELAEIRLYFQKVKSQECFFQKTYYDLIYKNRQRVLDHINQDGSPKGKYRFRTMMQDN